VSLANGGLHHARSLRAEFTFETGDCTKQPRGAFENSSLTVRGFGRALNNLLNKASASWIILRITWSFHTSPGRPPTQRPRSLHIEFLPKVTKEGGIRMWHGLLNQSHTPMRRRKFLSGRANVEALVRAGLAQVSLKKIVKDLGSSARQRVRCGVTPRICRAADHSPPHGRCRPEGPDSHAFCSVAHLWTLTNDGPTRTTSMDVVSTTCPHLGACSRQAFELLQQSFQTVPHHPETVQGTNRRSLRDALKDRFYRTPSIRTIQRT